jgi:hypothetical protein
MSRSVAPFFPPGQTEPAALGHATDPGSDDLAFIWTWEHEVPCYESPTYLSNPPDQDPYPSPDVNPRDMTDPSSCIFGDDGIYMVTLTVIDDDGGASATSTTITVRNAAPIARILGVFTGAYYPFPKLPHNQTCYLGLSFRNGMEGQWQRRLVIGGDGKVHAYVAQAGEVMAVASFAGAASSTRAPGGRAAAKRAASSSMWVSKNHR